MIYRRQARLVFVHSLIVLLLCGCGQAPELGTVATLDQAPGNITVTPDKRIIFSLHQFFSPDWRVAANRMEASDATAISLTRILPGILLLTDQLLPPSSVLAR